MWSESEWWLLVAIQMPDTFSKGWDETVNRCWPLAAIKWRGHLELKTCLEWLWKVSCLWSYKCWRQFGAKDNYWLPMAMQMPKIFEAIYHSEMISDYWAVCCLNFFFYLASTTLILLLYVYSSYLQTQMSHCQNHHPHSPNNHRLLKIRKRKCKARIIIN